MLKSSKHRLGHSTGLTSHNFAATFKLCIPVSRKPFLTPGKAGAPVALRRPRRGLLQQNGTPTLIFERSSGTGGWTTHHDVRQRSHSLCPDEGSRSTKSLPGSSLYAPETQGNALKNFLYLQNPGARVSNICGFQFDKSWHVGWSAVHTPVTSPHQCRLAFGLVIKFGMSSWTAIAIIFRRSLLIYTQNKNREARCHSGTNQNANAEPHTRHRDQKVSQALRRPRGAGANGLPSRWT